MKRLSWKYVAGLVDGEGCIDLQITKKEAIDAKYAGERGGVYVRPRLRITLAESGKHVLDSLQANFGGPPVSMRKRSGNPNWSDAFTWGLYGKQLRPFLQNIVNHLMIKAEQARICIWIIDEVTGKHVSDELRERLRDELKAMKRDPQRLSERAIAELSPLLDYEPAVRPWNTYRFDKCIVCGSNETPHKRDGICRRCYDRAYYHGGKSAVDAIVQSSM